MPSKPRKLSTASDIAPDTLIDSDRVVTRGTLAYFREKERK